MVTGQEKDSPTVLVVAPRKVSQVHKVTEGSARDRLDSASSVKKEWTRAADISGGAEKERIMVKT